MASTKNGLKNVPTPQMVPKKSFISLPANREGKNLHTQKSNVFINPPKDILTEPSAFLLSKHTSTGQEVARDTDSQQHTYLCFSLAPELKFSAVHPLSTVQLKWLLFQGSIAILAKSNLLKDPIPNVQKVKHWDN